MNLYESKALREVTGPAIRPGGLVLTDRALRFCALSPGERVLDVGCGGGATAVHLRQVHGLAAVGLDLSWTLLCETRTLSDPPLVIQGRAEAVPVADGCMAAVLCECVLSLLTEPESALVGWHRVLAPGGYLIVSDLYERSGPSTGRLPPVATRCCLEGAVDSRTLHERMQRAGFDVLLFEDHTRLLNQLAARLVWEHGSLDAFWSAAGGDCTTHGPGAGRPGYYLMIARKGANDHG